MGIIRTAVDKLIGTVDELFTSGDSTIDDAINYFNLVNDREQIRTRMKEIYAVGIKTERDPAKSTDVLETYTKKNFDVLVDAGAYETIPIGWGHKVVNAHATMFSEPQNKYTLVHDTVDDTEKAEAVLNRSREEGGFTSNIVRADRMSMQCGSSALLMSFEDDAVTYQVIKPTAIKAVFGTYIESNGVLRNVQTNNIEDASLIIIQLGAVDVNKWNYLAIYGRSSTYKQGRWVTYQSGNTAKVPELYQDGAIEFEIKGKYCNPLSYYANLNPDLILPEYPISVIHSGLTGDDDLLPTYNTIYQESLEFDVAASHTLGRSQVGATGTFLIERDNTAMSKPLPRTVNGVVALSPGMRGSILNYDSQAIEVAYNTLKKEMIDSAAGYSVPDYMISTDDYTLEASSGIALQVKTRPLIKTRRRRIEDNQPSVKKIFDVEKAFISLFSTEAEADIRLLEECRQVWDAGELELPENKKETVERLVSLLEKGITDTIGAIREYYQLSTDEEAIALYDKMKERADEYPPLTQEKEEQQVKARPDFRRGVQRIAG
jgi:hypothetical protein